MNRQQPGPCEWLDDYHDGELEPEATQLFERHLGGCERCRSRLDQLRQMRAALNSAAAPRLPDEAELRLRRRLHEELTERRAGEEILDLEGAARLLKLSLPEVVALLDELPAFELGGRLRFRRARIMAWLEEQEQKLAREREESAFHRAARVSAGSSAKIIRFPLP